MGQELPGGKDLEFVISKIALGDGPESFEAAKELIRTAGDRDLRLGISKSTTALQIAKDSVAMTAASEDLISYVKDQFALIYVQAFRMGQTHQAELDRKQFNEILMKAAEQSTVEQKESQTSEES